MPQPPASVEAGGLAGSGRELSPQPYAAQATQVRASKCPGFPPRPGVHGAQWGVQPPQPVRSLNKMVWRRTGRQSGPPTTWNHPVQTKLPPASASMGLKEKLRGRVNFPSPLPVSGRPGQQRGSCTCPREEVTSGVLLSLRRYREDHGESNFYPTTLQRGSVSPHSAFANVVLAGPDTR